jgi:hypothetical protein
MRPSQSSFQIKVRFMYLERVYTSVVGKSRLQRCLPHCARPRRPLPTRRGILLTLLSNEACGGFTMLEGLTCSSCHSYRFSLVLILIHAMLEPLVNLQLELETLMQDLSWELGRLFSRYANNFPYSHIEFEHSFKR